MKITVAYISVLIVFGIADAIWIPNVALPLYRDILQNLMIDQVRIVPAALFYFVYPVGLVVFAIRPGIETDSLFQTAWRAAFLGALCYGTYDLTNYATVKTWTLHVTIIDIAYGATVSAISSVVGHIMARRFA